MDTLVNGVLCWSTPLNSDKSGTDGTRRVTCIINPLTHDCGKDWSELQQTEHIR
jgi:hypothetical protein